MMSISLLGQLHRQTGRRPARVSSATRSSDSFGEDSWMWLGRLVEIFHNFFHGHSGIRDNASICISFDNQQTVLAPEHSQLLPVTLGSAQIKSHMSTWQSQVSHPQLSSSATAQFPTGGPVHCCRQQRYTNNQQLNSGRHIVASLVIGKRMDLSLRHMADLRIHQRNGAGL